MAERRALVMDGCGLDVKGEGEIGTGGPDIFALERRACGARSGRAKISVEKSSPPGAGVVLMDIRGCRSLLAQPPANGWHPSGMADGG